MTVFKNLQAGTRIATIWGPLPGCLPEKVDFPYILNHVPFKSANIKEQTLAIIAGFVLGSLIFIWPIRSEGPTAFLEIINPIQDELNKNGNIIYYIKNNLHLLFFILAGFISLIIIEYFSFKKNV